MLIGAVHRRHGRARKNFYNDYAKRLGLRRGGREDPEPLPRREEKMEAMAEVPDALVDACHLVGPAARIKDRAQRWTAAGEERPRRLDADRHQSAESARIDGGMFYRRLWRSRSNELTEGRGSAYVARPAPTHCSARMLQASLKPDRCIRTRVAVEAAFVHALDDRGRAEQVVDHDRSPSFRLRSRPANVQ